MQDTLIPEERILAIKETICGFIVEQAINEKGKYYYDGMSNIDNRSKYDDIV